MGVFWVKVLDVLKTCRDDVFGTGVCRWDKIPYQVWRQSDQLFACKYAETGPPISGQERWE